MSDIKQNIILESFALFRKYGIKSVTIEDISSNLGISKKTLYQYFECKDDLVKAVVDLHIQNETEIILRIQSGSGNAIDKMVGIVQYVFGLLSDLSLSTIYDLKKYHHDIYSYYEIKHKNFITLQIKHNLKEGKDHGFYRPDLNEYIIAALYTNMALSVTDKYLVEKSGLSAIAVYKEIIQYHIFGILSTKGHYYFESVETQLLNEHRNVI